MALLLRVGKQSDEDSSRQAVYALAAELTYKLGDRQSSLSSNACSTYFSLDTDVDATFNQAATAKNSVKANLDSYLVKAGTTIRHPTFSVADFYLYEFSAARNSVGGKTNYLADLFLEGRTAAVALVRKQVATMTIEVDSSSGQITDCHFALTGVAADAACTASYGMRWNTATMKCEEAFADDNAISNFICAPGFQGVPPNCLPIPSTCANGQIATAFSMSQVRGCVTPPLQVSVLNARLAEPLGLAEGAMLPTPLPLPSQPVFNLQLPVQSTASTSVSTASNSCSDGTAVSALSFESCDGSANFPNIEFSANSCLWNSPPVVATSCTIKPQVNYVTPDLSITPPDHPAPPDLSCQCNNRRIADGEYCMFCIADANLGYGYSDYIFGVTQCQAGNLADVSGPAIGTPVGQCNNSYGRAKLQSGRFYQYNEIP